MFFFFFLYSSTAAKGRAKKTRFLISEGVGSLDVVAKKTLQRRPLLARAAIFTRNQWDMLFDKSLNQKSNNFFNV